MNNKEKNDRLPRKLKSKGLEELSFKKKKSTFLKKQYST